MLWYNYKVDITAVVSDTLLRSIFQFDEIDDSLERFDSYGCFIFTMRIPIHGKSFEMYTKYSSWLTSEWLVIIDICSANTMFVDGI